MDAKFLFMDILAPDAGAGASCAKRWQSKGIVMKGDYTLYISENGMLFS